MILHFFKQSQNDGDWGTVEELSMRNQLFQRTFIKDWNFVFTYQRPDLPCSSDGKEFACNAGDLGLIPGLGRSPGEGNGNLLQYSCLENPMDREAWRPTVCGVAKSWTRLRDTTTATTIKDLLDVQFQMCSVKLSFLTFLDLWNVNGLISDEKRSPQKAGLTCFESFLVLLQHGL